MSKQEKSGFIYIWRDNKHNRYYVGCHWGFENDGYICSSKIMKKAFKRRPYDFKRRIIKRNILSRPELYVEELRYLQMIKPEEIKIRYYNLNIINNEIWHKYPENIKTIGQKISFSNIGKNTGPRDPSVGKNISLAKTESFKKRRLENENGKAFTQEHIDKMIQSKLDSNHKHTSEWKEKMSLRLKEQWESGNRNRNPGPISEEHKLKLSIANKGKKLKQEQIDLLRINNSKQYIIEKFSGEIINISGLKEYGKENDIPYVTLRKCYELKRPIKKYNIREIYI
ncbi:MAG: NUMOD3 domain-containing DNA-binding protein [Candidatus Levybacteria bacterium]|nr:NUMOD3 domain-containing DNA-binding protein [Candidatus Levybacteria bacterium]